MRSFLIVIIVLGLMGCSEIDSAQQHIKKIQELEQSNRQLRNNVENLKKEIGATSEKLSSSQREIKQLRDQNEALEKMSEERIRKFWSMYEPDA